MTIRIRLYLATAIMGCTTLIHAFQGEVDVHAPLLAAAPTAEMGLYVTLLWHFVTVFAAWATLSLALTIWRPHWHPLAVSAAVLCLGMGALFIGIGLVRLGDIWTAPQWILLLPVAALVLWPQPTTVSLRQSRSTL